MGFVFLVCARVGLCAVCLVGVCGRGWVLGGCVAACVGVFLACERGCVCGSRG